MNTSRTSVVMRAVLVLVVVAAIVPITASAGGAPQRVIVIFEDGPTGATHGRLAALGAQANAALPLVHGAAMTLPPGLSLGVVSAVPGVAHVEADSVVHALKPAPPAQPAQTIPWGVDRIEAETVWSSTTGDPVKVAVVDTGIDTSHPDLSANLKGGYNAINPSKSYTDDNGHGTHVAGTVAAALNTIGVAGVAPAADLYAIKVLGRSGSGYVSDIIEGIQWAVAHDADVINMSLGSAYYSLSFDMACQQAIDTGVTIVAAAGNEGPALGTVSYPAKYARVIGVSAVDRNDLIAGFSSVGPGVDVAAPGVGIFSTYKGQRYATLSGTSMASPHVAGVAALVLTTPVGSDDADGDGVWDPAEVQHRLSRTAQDLGATGTDSYYGAGLVRADSAAAAH